MLMRRKPLLVLISRGSSYFGKCLIYFLTCNKCNKQYVGQTVDNFLSRWKNYKPNCRKYTYAETCMEEYLFERFCDKDNVDFLSDVSIRFLDKTDPSNALKRKNY